MKARLLGLIKVSWVVLILSFAALFAFKYQDKLYESLDLLSAEQVLLALLFLLVGKVFMALVTHKVINSIPDSSFSFQHSFYAYNASQLPKYMPGSIWQHVSRAFIYKDFGIAQTAIAESILYETIWLLFSALAFGVLAMLFTQPETIYALFAQGRDYLMEFDVSETLLWAVAVVVLILGFFLAFKLRELMLKALTRLLTPDVIVLVSLVALWLVMGVSVAQLLPSQDQELTITNLVYIAGVFAFAYGVGYASPFAPAGLGVRETIMVIGLLPFAPALELAILIGFHRFLYLVADLFFAGVAWWVKPRP